MGTSPRYKYLIIIAILAIILWSFFTDYETLLPTSSSFRKGATITHHVTPKAVEEEEEPWIPIHHSNPNFPSDNDILCQTHSKHCQRICKFGRQNEILYLFRNSAGLKDRQQVLQWLTELAAYLCATVHVLPPSHLLAKRHNQKQMVSRELQWSDFWKFSLYGSNSNDTPLKLLRQETFKEDEAEDWQVILTNPNKTKAIGESFQQAVTHSMSSQKFVWMFHPNYFQVYEPLSEALREVDTSMLGLPERIVQNCQNLTYVEQTRAEVMVPIIEDLWQSLRHRHPNHIFGYWHIRRGNGGELCDTSLQRMQVFARCTFSNISSKVVVLLGSDETNTTYHAELQSTFQKINNQVELVWLDSLVKEYMNQQQLPLKYHNNFHLFEIGNGLASKATAFQLQHRRDIDCQDCYNLQQHLSTLDQKT